MLEYYSMDVKAMKPLKLAACKECFMKEVTEKNWALAVFARFGP